MSIEFFVYFCTSPVIGWIGTFAGVNGFSPKKCTSAFGMESTSSDIPCLAAPQGREKAPHEAQSKSTGLGAEALKRHWELQFFCFSFFFLALSPFVHTTLFYIFLLFRPSSFHVEEKKRWHVEWKPVGLDFYVEGAVLRIHHSFVLFFICCVHR